MLKKAKLTELENKTPEVSSLATETALTAVENKIPSVGKKNRLWQKNYWNWKVWKLTENWKLTDHNYDKYITTAEFNTSAAEDKDKPIW